MLTFTEVHVVVAAEEQRKFMQEMAMFEQACHTKKTITQTNTHLHTDTRKQTKQNTHVHTYLRICTSTRMHTYIWNHIYIYVYICVYIHTHAYIHVHIRVYSSIAHTDI